MLAAAPAAAHPVLRSSEPPANTVVAQRPSSVRLEFGEPVEDLAQIRVYNDRGLRVDRGATHTNGRIVSVALVTDLTPGTYVVHWRAVGVDGHPASDSLVFDYLRPTRAGVVHEARDTTARTRGIARWFALVLLAFVLGRALFGRSWASPGWAIRPAALGAVVALMVLLAFDASGLSGLPLSRALDWSVLTQVLRTTTGHTRLVQIALSAAAVLAPIVAAPAAALALAAEAFAGHAATAPHPAAAEFVQAVHVTAMGVWLGGLALIATPRGRTVGDRTRWRRAALGAVIVLLVTGTLNGLVQVGTADRLLQGRAEPVPPFILHVCFERAPDVEGVQGHAVGGGERLRRQHREAGQRERAGRRRQQPQPVGGADLDHGERSRRRRVDANVDRHV